MGVFDANLLLTLRFYRWATPAAAVVVAFLLIGVENIGVQIEQPFAVLPISRFTATMRKDMLDMLASHRYTAPDDSWSFTSNSGCCWFMHRGTRLAICYIHMCQAVLGQEIWPVH